MYGRLYDPSSKPIGWFKKPNEEEEEEKNNKKAKTKAKYDDPTDTCPKAIFVSGLQVRRTTASIIIL